MYSGPLRQNAGSCPAEFLSSGRLGHGSPDGLGSFRTGLVFLSPRGLTAAVSAASSFWSSSFLGRSCGLEMGLPRARALSTSSSHSFLLLSVAWFFWLAADPQARRVPGKIHNPSSFTPLARPNALKTGKFAKKGINKTFPGTQRDCCQTNMPSYHVRYNLSMSRPAIIFAKWSRGGRQQKFKQVDLPKRGFNNAAYATRIRAEGIIKGTPILR